MESGVRVVRLIQFSMLASIVVYAGVGELVGGKHPTENNIFHVLSLVSIIIIGAILVVRRTLVLPSEQLLNQKPGDTLRLARWRGSYLFMYAMCEAVALVGLALRFLGFSLSNIWGFYLGGFVLLLLFSPRPPSSQFR
jgi:hypothetical protein